MGFLGWLDSIPAATDRWEVEVLDRVDRDLVSADRPAEDDAQGIEDVRDGGGGEALTAEAVDEVLNISALQLGQLPPAEGWDDVRVEQLLVAARRRRLVRLPCAVEDRAVVRAADQDLGRLANRLRGCRAHRAAA